MTVKAQYKLDHLLSLLPRIRKSFQELMGKDLVSVTKQQIESGISSVKGEGRFKRYSDIYVHAITTGVYHQFSKFVRPVNLTLSGLMLSTMKAVAGEKVVTLSISNRLAKVHNTEGAGKSKVIRRLLPDRPGEEFSRPINVYLKLALRKAVTREAARSGLSGHFTDKVRSHQT